ncbi:MAG: MBL fold metallo-hydrolase [Spirochaetales bacterium]|uniref:MBL fold metallo-hydrolase n=1 Tax=Candidatus Thalassospirochaeta sargassi TaxID=3119039 RepID=A0AAJ1IAQ3_9SPIO|nr:MBL fold metallo-hydrolase [Spirochaetales bacterium]
MKVKFWGVRGSIPTPIKPSQLQSRIAAIVQRIQPSDLVSQESRDAFLAGIPPYLIETVGGNTTCIEIRLKDNSCIIIDAGSGIRELGINILKKRENIKKFHIFFTHFHWDHILGLPFFDPAYIPGYELHFYSPVKHMESALRSQMELPYFPVTMDAFGADLHFHTINDEIMNISGAEISWRRVKHPGGCFSYKISEGGKDFIFSTDTELTERDFRRSPENTEFYEGTDLIVMDSQYTLGEAIEKYDWGHSSYSLAVDFASEWKIPKVVLFHHEPKYEDKKIYKILNSAKWYEKHIENSNLEIYLAKEELEFTL